MDENFEDFAWQLTLKKNDLSAQKEKMKYQKANALVQVGSVAAMLAGAFVPGIGAVGYIGSSVASPYLQYKGYKTDTSAAEVKINTKITQGMTNDQAKMKIKQIAIHQLGHALGIYGHSSNPSDIMYANFTVNQLSERDIKTINVIYKKEEPDKKAKKKKKKDKDNNNDVNTNSNNTNTNTNNINNTNSNNISTGLKPLN